MLLRFCLKEFFMHRRVSIAGLMLVFLACPALAEVKPHALISRGMVLQQGMRVPIWGTADDGEKVTVRFQDQEVSTTAKNGKWLVRLENMKAGGPFEMTIKGNNEIKIPNVLVGDVWVCSGQSNMWWLVKLSEEPERVKAASENQKIRLLTVPQHREAEPQRDVKVSCVHCEPNAVNDFSAVAYHCGKHLEKALDVPVGLIHTSVGGTAAEEWTSKATHETTPGLEGLKGSGLYNAMIAPLQPYAIAGAIWYQGESNAGRA